MHHNPIQAEALNDHIRQNYGTAKLNNRAYARVAARDLKFTVTDYHVRTVCKLLGIPTTFEIRREELAALRKDKRSTVVKHEDLLGRIDAIEADQLANRRELKHLREFVLAMNAELERA